VSFVSGEHNYSALKSIHERFELSSNEKERNTNLKYIRTFFQNHLILIMESKNSYTKKSKILIDLFFFNSAAIEDATLFLCFSL